MAENFELIWLEDGVDEISVHPRGETEMAIDNPFGKSSEEKPKLEFPKPSLISGDSEPTEAVSESQDVIADEPPTEAVKEDKYAHMSKALRQSEKQRLLDLHNGEENDIPKESPYWEL